MILQGIINIYRNGVETIVVSFLLEVIAALDSRKMDETSWFLNQTIYIF